MGLVHIFPYTKTHKNQPSMLGTYTIPPMDPSVMGKNYGRQIISPRDRSSCRDDDLTSRQHNLNMPLTPRIGPLNTLNNLGQLVTAHILAYQRETKTRFLDGNPECKLKTCKSKNTCISKVFVQSLLVSYLCLVNLTLSVFRLSCLRLVKDEIISPFDGRLIKRVVGGVMVCLICQALVSQTDLHNLVSWVCGLTASTTLEVDQYPAVIVRQVNLPHDILRGRHLSDHDVFFHATRALVIKHLEVANHPWFANHLQTSDG